MSDVVISEFMDEAAIRAELAGFDVRYEPDLVDRRSDLLAAVATCRGLIVRNRTQVNGELLDAAPAVEVVGRLGVGLDNIDTDLCRERGVAVLPATGANDLAVAEYVVMAAFALLRDAWHATGATAAGNWPRTDCIGREVHGKRIGLVGFGSIARLTAAKASALGMQVAAFDPYLPADSPVWDGIEKVTLEELAARSDVLSLHVPLTEETRHLVDARVLSLRPKGSVVINAARGGVVDEGALVAALRNGHLGGAAIDVFESEPLDAASASVFRDLPNVLLTPHIAGVTAESNVRVSAMTAAGVAKHLKGNERGD